MIPAPNLQIGGLDAGAPVVPAPLCGISDRAWRILAREQGCTLTCTQMVSCEAVVYDDPKTWGLLDIEGEAAEGLVAVQLLGHRPETLAEAARRLEAKGAALVDLNMGCPARKVVNSSGGSALLRQPEQVRAILRAMRAAIRIPLTVKIRAGWSESGREAFEIARIAEGEGVDAVILHARTREQAYKGRADWSLIAALREQLRVPVIGNGDVFCADDAERMRRETNCAAVMIGRGAMGNPWLLGACVARLRGEPDPPAPLLAERIAMMRRHARLMAARRGEGRGVIEFRKHAVAYLRGLRGSHVVKCALMKTHTLAELETCLDSALERASGQEFDCPADLEFDSSEVQEEETTSNPAEP